MHVQSFACVDQPYSHHLVRFYTFSLFPSTELCISVGDPYLQIVKGGEVQVPCEQYFFKVKTTARRVMTEGLEIEK